MTRSPLALLDDADFETEVRVMLTRRAADVSPSASAPPVTATTNPIAAGDPYSLTSTRSVGESHTRARRWLAAAAAALVVGGVAVVIGEQDSPDNATVTGTAEPIGGTSFPAPGAEGWDPATAPPVWPVVGDAALAHITTDHYAVAGDLATPAGAAGAYLANVASLLAVDVAGVEVSADGRTAEVPWLFHDDVEPGGPPEQSGSIHLRQVGNEINPLWVVVGAVPEGLALDEVRSDGRRLSFTVVADPAGDSISVRVGVDGRIVSTGGEPLPQGGPPDPASGELVRLPPEGRRGVEIDVQPGQNVDILVREVGGDFLSVTHMTVAVPAASSPADPAPPSAETGTTATTAADDLPPPGFDVVSPPPGDPAGPAAEHIEGSYRGNEQFGFTTGGCPDLDHFVDSWFELVDGTTWRHRSEYCVPLDGESWSGQGTFTFTTPSGDTITGVFSSSATLPSEGEPYDLTITGGTGTYAQATGSCHLDNHLSPTGLGRQEQYGTFSCDIDR